MAQQDFLPSEAFQMKLSQVHKMAPELAPSDRAVYCQESKYWDFLEHSVSAGSLHALHTEHTGIPLSRGWQNTTPLQDRAFHKLLCILEHTNQLLQQCPNMWSSQKQLGKKRFYAYHSKTEKQQQKFSDTGPLSDLRGCHALYFLNH